MKELTFEEYVDREFEKNLELAREELALESEDTHGEMEYSERRAWNVAREWTEDDIVANVASYIERKWWNKQDVVNKVFYE